MHEFKIYEYFMVAIISSIITYGNYLCQNNINTKIVSVIYVGIFIYYTYTIFIKQLES